MGADTNILLYPRARAPEIARPRAALCVARRYQHLQSCFLSSARALVACCGLCVSEQKLIQVNSAHREAALAFPRPREAVRATVFRRVFSDAASRNVTTARA